MNRDDTHRYWTYLLWDDQEHLTGGHMNASAKWARNALDAAEQRFAGMSSQARRRVRVLVPVHGYMYVYRAKEPEAPYEVVVA